MAGGLFHPKVSELITVKNTVIRLRRHPKESQLFQIAHPGEGVISALPHDNLSVLRYQHGKIREPHLGNRIKDQPFSGLFHRPFQNQPSLLIPSASQHQYQGGKGDSDHRRHDEHIINDEFPPQPADFLHVFHRFLTSSQSDSPASCWSQCRYPPLKIPVFCAERKCIPPHCFPPRPHRFPRPSTAGFPWKPPALC